MAYQQEEEEVCTKNLYCFQYKCSWLDLEVLQLPWHLQHREILLHWDQSRWWAGNGAMFGGGMLVNVVWQRIPLFYEGGIRGTWRELSSVASVRRGGEGGTWREMRWVASIGVGERERELIDRVMRVQEGREKWVLFIITQGKILLFPSFEKTSTCMSKWLRVG